jgi:nitrite reductase/ring-hydroxylating ferredoxin subunit
VSEERPDLEAALVRLDRIIASAEADPDPAFRERVAELLDTIDAVHRQLVWRVGELVHAASAELFERTLLRDPVASMLFEMYGLVAPDETAAEAAPEAAPEARPLVSLADLEASLPVPVTWHEAARASELRAGSIIWRDIAGERVALLSERDALRAYRDECPGSPMPISSGTLRAGELHCPWHDCRYDALSGRRLDREGPPLAAVPVEVRDGTLRVGVRQPQRSVA